MNETTVERYGVGQPVRRKEDARFLTGAGRYIDDESLEDPPESSPGQIGHASVNLTLTRLKPGKYVFLQQWYHPHHFYPFEPERVQHYMNIRNHPLSVSTNNSP